MKIGYARVSTDDQKMDLQRDALTAAGCEKVFTDTASGAKAERPGLADALAFARKGDSLVVWRLDRLGRSLPELVKIVGELEAAGVGFESTTERIETSTAAGRLVFHVFAALAEFERRLIVERTMAGLAAARARGRKGGRPGLPAEKIAAIQSLVASGRGPAEVCKALGIGRSTFYKHAYAVEETTGSAYAALGMDDAEGMAAKAGIAMQIQEAIKAQGLTNGQAATLLGLSVANLSELLRGQFRTISEADMRDYLGRLAAPAKGKRRRATGDKKELARS